MDEHPGNAAPRAASDNLRSESEIQRYLADPNAAQSYRQEAEARNSRLPEISKARAFTGRLRDLEQYEIERRYHAKKEADLMRHCAGEVHTPARFVDLLTIILFWSVALGGIGGGMNALATYVSDSGLIPGLDGNFPRALLFSFFPVSAAFLAKALGDLQPNDTARLRYYLRLGFVGGCAVVLAIVAMSATYAPRTIDTAAIADQLASGHIAATASSFGDYASFFVLGSGLLAETCISAVLLGAATKISHSRRKLVVTPNEVLDVHDRAIADHIERIAKHSLTLANLDAEETRIHAQIDADANDLSNVLQMFNVQQKKNLRRVIDEFHGKKGGK